LLGGGLVALANWRAVFAVNVVIGIPAALWAWRAMPTVVPGHGASRPGLRSGGSEATGATREGREPQPHDPPRRSRGIVHCGRRLDVAGMGTATAFIGGLVFALIEAPVRGWSDPAILGGAAVAVVGLVSFVWVERSVRSPLLPPGVYADRGFAAAAIQGSLLNFAFYGVLFSMSLLLQQGRHLSALVTGLLFLPLTGLISIANIGSAPLALLALGQAVITVAMLGLAWASTASAVWPMVLALVPIGFSSGLLVPTMTAQSIAAVEPALHGAASAAFNTSRQIGGAIGVATFGPLLGTAHDLGSGFVTCAIVAAAASLVGLAVTALGRRTPELVRSTA